MKKVRISDIRIDGGTQGREVIDQEWVQGFLEKMKEGETFPPLSCTFDGTVYWLWDGFHRYLALSQLNLAEVDVEFTPGTQADAQVLALSANAKHGKPRTNSDKIKVVKIALSLPQLKGKTDTDIGKLCGVSRSFVGAIRSPEVKARQSESKTRAVVKKAKEIEKAQEPVGAAPDDSEMQATEMAIQADMEAMHKLLEASEPLQEAHEEIKRLNYLNSQLNVRIHALMNERNEAIKITKKAQKDLKKAQIEINNLKAHIAKIEG
jgi:hypothetical protein